MSARTVTVRTSTGTCDVPGLPCGVPGLAIAPALHYPAIWSLIHVRSGLAVAWFSRSGPEAALACAQDLGDLDDWTQPMSVLGRADAVRIAVVARWGGTDSLPSMQVATDAELAADLADPGMPAGGAA